MGTPSNHQPDDGATEERELDNQGNAERGVVIAGHPNAVLLFGSTWAEERFQCTCPLV
jgi:hypothetical protein